MRFIDAIFLSVDVIDHVCLDESVLLFGGFLGISCGLLQRTDHLLSPISVWCEEGIET